MATTATGTLIGYLQRLNNGEPLESVQKDFRAQFETVPPEAIMEAEQEMLAAGVPLERIQRLCDLHSALFHGEGEPEQPAPQAPAPKQQSFVKPSSKSEDINVPAGHPLDILMKENTELMSRLQKLHNQLEQHAPAVELADTMQDLSPVSTHLAKKDELVIVPLKHYGFPGPSDVMWNVDIELRDEHHFLLHELQKLAENPDETMSAYINRRIEKYIKRAQEMVFKENNVLYPMAKEHFTDQDWRSIKADMPKFGYAWLREIPAWPGEALEPSQQSPLPEVQVGSDTTSVYITLPTGRLSVPEIEGILRTLPFELTFIDAQDTNRYFSEDSKLFPRPLNALGQNMLDCHPANILSKVKTVLTMLKSGEKDCITLVMPKQGRKALVRYMAVRSKGGTYLGTLEVVEDITDYPTGE